MLLVLLDTKNEYIFLVLVYPTGPIYNFIVASFQQLSQLSPNFRTPIIRDSDIDQGLGNNVEKLNPWLR